MNYATITFTDGNTQEIAHGKAVRINAVLEGERKPENKEQEEFISKIAQIDFKPVVLKQPGTSHRPQHDPEMKKILENPALRGLMLWHAVGMRIRKRVQENAE